MKKIFVLFMTGVLLVGAMAGCGKKAEGNTAANLSGTCSEILEKVYKTAELDQDFKDALQYFDNTAIPSDDDEMEAYMIGTNDVNYTDSVFSAPMMSSIAYQCVLLRLEDGQDVEAAKEALRNGADPRKWVCVEAESVQVENVGDVVMVIMADEAKANAMIAAFKALAN